MANQQYFNRYEAFTVNGSMSIIPGLTISESTTDKRVVYKKGLTRMDKLSQDYYGNPYHGFLIMLANQQFGGLEFTIPDGEVIRIPFPFNRVLEVYDQQVETHKTLYGN